MTLLKQSTLFFFTFAFATITFAQTSDYDTSVVTKGARLVQGDNGDFYILGQNQAMPVLQKDIDAKRAAVAKYHQELFASMLKQAKIKTAVKLAKESKPAGQVKKQMSLKKPAHPASKPHTIAKSNAKHPVVKPKRVAMHTFSGKLQKVMSHTYCQVAIKKMSPQHFASYKARNAKLIKKINLALNKMNNEFLKG